MTSTLSRTLAAICAVSGLAAAQQSSLLFATTGNERTLRPGGNEATLARPDEMTIVTPTAGAYSATVFMTVGVQWAYVGDKNNNGRLVDYENAAPGDDFDAILVKRYRPSGAFGPRDIFFSKSTSTGLATNDEDGSVFRYATQGTLETFVSEAQILTAIGQASTSDCDLDAICQDVNGDLFLSFNTTESINGTNALDGALIRIPATGITYNLQGNAIAIASGVAEIVATEADVGTWMTASDVRNSVRRRPSTSLNLSGLEIDPDGGTWTSPVTNQALPNLLFAWSGGDNEGAVLTTRNGGDIARLNGVPLGSAVETNGTQIGLLPSRTGIGGLNAIGVVPRQVPPVAVEVWPVNLITTSVTLYTRQEISNATPNGNIVVFFDVAIGSNFASTVLPPFQGELFGAGLLNVTAVTVADANGYGSATLVLPASVLSGSQFAVAWQVLDVGSLSFGIPSAMQIL